MGNIIIHYRRYTNRFRAFTVPLAQVKSSTLGMSNMWFQYTDDNTIKIFTSQSSSSPKLV